MSTTSATNTQFLPAAYWRTTSTPASRGSLSNASKSASERQLTLSAENAALPIIYGRDRRGALIANILAHAGKWVVQCVWGEGPIDAIEAVHFSDKALPAGVTVTHYLGEATQPVNPALAAAFAAKGISYTDTLPFVAYSVFQIPESDESWDSISAIIRGRKVYDPRTNSVSYSANPALALADIMSNTRYGGGRTIDWSSVAAAADACDVLVGGAPRRTIGLTIDTPTVIDELIEVLRTYAGCLRPVLTKNGWRIIPDRAEPVSGVYSHADGSIRSISPIRKRGILDTPTVVRVTWTDTSAIPWRDREAIARLPGVLEGTVPRREQSISLPGIQSYSQALREATERLNKLTLSDISFTIDVFDDGLAHDPGDVISVTHPVGLSSKQVRILSIQGELGRYTFDVSEYDPAVYSDVVMTEPTSYDTDLPDPSSPQPITGLSLSEEVFRMQNGTYSSRIAAVWNPPASYPYVDHYRIDVKSAGVSVFTGTSRNPVFRTPAIQEGLEYAVEVTVVSILGDNSQPETLFITAQGKQLPPGNVPSISGFEAGGEVRLSWSPAIDIDIWRYEVRYTSVGGSWASGKLIDRVDGLRLVAAMVPAGTWDFMVKALDSVGRYSPVEARRTITVTLDTNAFLVDEIDFESPTVSNMSPYQLGRLDSAQRWVTDDGISMASKFVGALSSYSDTLATYNNVASSWQTEAYDFGLLLSGNWQGELSITPVLGSASAFIDLSTDGSLWDEFENLITKATARFVRLRAVSNAGNVFSIALSTASARIDAIPRVEDGKAISAASGPTTIVLASEYVSAKRISVTPLGTAPRTYSVDAVTMGSPSSFDVYIFDISGTQVASGFRWNFEGV